ncbi:MAG: peptidylprolyl isomerase, partial [Desulfobacteraceae bacterium]
LFHTFLITIEKGIQMNRNIIILIVALIVSITCPALAQENPRVQMETSKGTIIIELDAKAAPETVANFLEYVKKGFYDGTIFHRVIKNFMIQGGGFTQEMKQKTTSPAIQNEADNGLKNKVGTIAMARTNVPHSATSQFFINVKDNTFLDHKAKTARGWGYCVFGRVTKGMEVVKAIENVSTGTKSGHRDVPVTPVQIKRITVQ